MKKVFKLFTLIGIILVISFLYFYFNYQFWTYVKTDNFNSLVEYNGQNIKGLFGRQILVNKDFKNDLDQIDKYAIFHDIVLIINQSYRSEEETINRKIVRPAKQSNHLAGFAIDFNIESNGVKYYANDLKRNNLKMLPNNIQEFINDIRHTRNLRWGGDFQNEDPIHIDHPINILSRKKWLEYSKSCALDFSNANPAWGIF